jgi:hypothetical protein
LSELRGAFLGPSSPSQSCYDCRISNGSGQFLTKKVRKAIKRAAAREELAREKAARQVEKEIKKARKTREAELRKIEIEKRA